jgi:hypothetical protein
MTTPLGKILLPARLAPGAKTWQSLIIQLFS